MDSLKYEFLEPKNRLPEHLVDKLQPKIQLNVSDLASKIAVMPAYNPRQRLHFARTGLDGHIEDMQLVPVALSSIQGTGSMSMNRRVNSLKNNIRGRSGQMPFTPGGLEIQQEVSVQQLHRDADGLLDIAPGLFRSGKFDGSADLQFLGDDAHMKDDEKETGSDDDTTSEVSEPVDVTDGEEKERLAHSNHDDIDELLPNTTSFVRNISLPTTAQPKERTWAHVVDVNQKIDNFHELVPHPARTWPFELDTFQKEAVYRLEQGDSVFIAAHTSAGKTVVAEYAMSLAAQHMTKCIYTSPIKALSNQKYRDFKEEYDVGILTGDVQLNPEAGTLIMTTEILRSMLYRGADVIRDVEFIIFDEVHYVNDSERGVVWEEVIIMLPDHVKLVLLSATVPNTFEFANWVGRTKEKDVYVISTPKRPVPLKHHIWLKKEMIEIVNDKRQLLIDNYKNAENLLKPPKAQTPTEPASRGGRGGATATRGGGTARGGSRGGRGNGNSGAQAMQRQMGRSSGRFNAGSASKSELHSLVSHLNTKKLLPAVMFVFSRKMTEQYAEFIQSVSLNTGKEKSQVHLFVSRAVQRLRKEDRDLPQIQMLLSMLQRGIGVHHSGLLPIMKEVVEILFAKGLVKMLFATETFAMGLNLPTRTVVFTAIRKFDSKTMRYLTPGEYTQMAGRAGRRGLDTVGTVIIMNNNKEEVIPRKVLDEMILGTPLKLSSQFRLTYNMILSLLRIEAVKVEDVIQQSFSENSNNIMRPQHQQKLLKIDRATKTINGEILKDFGSSVTELVDAMKTYLESARVYRLLNTTIYNSISSLASKNAIFRYILYTYTPSKQYAVTQTFIGLVINVIAQDRATAYRVMTIGVVDLGIYDQFPNFFVGFADKLADIKVSPYYQKRVAVVASEDVLYMSQNRFKGVRTFSIGSPSREAIDSLIAPFQQSKVSDSTDGNAWKEWSFDWVKNMNVRMAIRDRKAASEELVWAGDSLFNMLETTRYLSSRKVGDLLPKAKRLFVLESEARAIESSNSGTNAALLPEYGQRVDLLRSANYIDEGMIVALKGRVACEISTGYELYVTELIMDNFLGSFEPEEIVALLSVFVFEGARGAEDPPTVTPRLDEGKQRLLELVDYVQRLADEYHVSLTQDEADFAENNRFALMQVVYEWARGMTFNEITQLTNIQEGTIVRVINRLDEVCRSVMSAARIIGEVELYDKLATAQELIKRDIVFCSSLYI